MTTSIPAVGKINDISNTRVALVQGNQLVSAALPGIAAALKTEMGAGNVAGPASSTDGNIAVFDGATGAKLKDGGSKIADLMPKSGGAFTGGISMSASGASGTDLSKGIALYSTNYGFCVTSSTVNYSSNIYHKFWSTSGGDTQLVQIGSNGVVIGAPTGGVPGAGKINAVDYQINGAALSSIFTGIADLASTSAGKGASLVGVQDSAGNFTATTVEAVLAELQANIENVPAYGAVNTYVFGYTETHVTEGSTYAGSVIYPAGIMTNNDAVVSVDGATAGGSTRGADTLSGTWRAMGRNQVASRNKSVTLFLRIA